MELDEGGLGRAVAAQFMAHLDEHQRAAAAFLDADVGDGRGTGHRVANAHRAAELELAAGTRERARIEDECGDLLFAVVNLARHLDVDPEKALTGANYKFERRFRAMEADIGADGGDFRGMSLESLDKRWRMAKKRVG